MSIFRTDDELALVAGLNGDEPAAGVPTQFANLTLVES
jgi:hypothetical protein